MSALLHAEPALAPPPVRATGPVRRWAARRPVTAFLTLLFLIAYPLMLLVAAASHGLVPGADLPGPFGLPADRLSALLVIYAAMVPVTVWVTWAADGRAGVVSLCRRATRWRVAPGWWLLVLLALPTSTLALSLLLGDRLTGGDAATLVVEQAVGFVAGFLLVNWWEEVAWSGFLQTRLERRHNIAVAALLTSVPFALVHLPLELVGDVSVVSVVAGLAVLLALAPVFRLMLAVFLRGTRDSVLLVALLHTAFNRSNNDDGIVAAVTTGEAHRLAGLVASLLLTAVVAVVARRRLTRSFRATLDEGARA